MNFERIDTTANDSGGTVFISGEPEEDRPLYIDVAEPDEDERPDAGMQMLAYAIVGALLVGLLLVAWGLWGLVK